MRLCPLLNHVLRAIEIRKHHTYVQVAWWRELAIAQVSHGILLADGGCRHTAADVYGFILLPCTEKNLKSYQCFLVGDHAADSLDTQRFECPIEFHLTVCIAATALVHSSPFARKTKDLAVFVYF
jgi:hypothetical protein